MEGPGLDATCTLSDGRLLDYWEGGDPEGRGVLFQPGSPCTRVLGRQGHDAAADLGIRLVSISRPGYGGSTLPSEAPSLLRTGRGTAALARQLGMSEYAVLGASGGGPFAVGTAVADPDGVQAVGLVAASGPWTVLNEPTDGDAEERELLSLLDAGDVDGAWAGYRALMAGALGGLLEPGDEERVDAFFAGVPESPDDHGTRPLWVANLAEVAAGLDGLVFDNLAWGGRWDVEPGSVQAPTALWYGDADAMVPMAHGRWYADRMPGAEVTVHPGEGHAAVCSSHWKEQLGALLDRWGSRRVSRG